MNKSSLVASRGIGVRGRLFGALAVTASLALGIGLAAHGAFNRLHAGITEVTAERFPAVVASARLERQHQRIMRTLRELAAAGDNLERETVDQGLSDQLAGYERLLADLPAREGHDARQVANLRAQYLEMVRLRDAIDARVNERAAAGRAVRELDREAVRLNDALDEPPLNGAPRDGEAATIPAVAAWREPVRRALFLIASAHRVENRFALTRLAGDAADALVIARGALPELPDAAPPARRTAEEVTRGLTRLVIGEESIFAHRGRQLEAAGGLGGLLERANQVSLLITGLTSGIFVEQTRLAEESRHDLLVISDTHTRLFLAASLVVALVGALSLAYVQRSIVARLWAVRDALRRRAEGEMRPIPVQGADEIGELARALSFHIAQTEEKNEALRRNERWLRATLEAAPVPLAIARLDDGVMRFVNHRAAELLGAEDADSFVGRSIAGLWRSVIVWEGFVDEIVKHAVAVDLEAELLTTPGRRFWGLVSGTLIEFEGEPVLLVALVDITRRRRAESLARRTQRELREAKERAERADATKTEFLATLSHEMRTPLNGILGLGRVLLNAPLGEVERRHVGSIMRCGGTLLDQVNDILDLRKIEDGKLDLDPVPCPVAPFLDDVLVTVSPMADEKAIGLDLRVADDIPPAVVVDPQRLRQILVNLVGNAVKFTENGGVTVAVTREPTGAPPTEDDAGEWLVARVRDTGIGIPPDRHAAIFEKLEQGDPSISRRFGGSGLGLAIARHLANAMGGDIAVDSLPGLGSTFTLRVPLIVATEAGDAPGDGTAPPPVPGGPLALLLVEDDQINREVAVGLLGAAGHAVTIATTGAAAVELANIRDFDAILLDMRLPDFDGVEVAERVRALVDPARARVPIIAVTANVFATDKLRYMEAGVDAIVEKPIFPERLARTLASLTGTTPTGIAPTGAPTPAPASSPETPAESSPIDETVLARYHAALGPTRFDAIRELLIEGARDGLPRLEASGTPVDDIADIAHRLAGAGSHFGLRDFVARMRVVEDLAREGRREAATAAAVEGTGAFDGALAAMDEWRGRLPEEARAKPPVAAAPPAG